MGGDLFGEAFKEVLVQKVETDSALAKAVSTANKSSGPKVFQRPQCSRAAESGGFFFRGPGQSIRGLARQDQLSVQKLIEREAHPRSNFCKESKCVQQTGPQSNRAPQTYRPTAELAEVHSKELKQAGRLN